MADIVSSFLNLPAEAQKEVLRRRNKKFSDLPEPAQDEFIRRLEQRKSETIQSFLGKEIPEGTRESTIARDIFDFAEKTGEAGAVVFGGAGGAALGFASPVPGGTAIGGVLGAGSALTATRSLFNSVEGLLGNFGVEGFEETKPISETTGKDVLNVGKSAISDFAEGARDEALGQGLVKAGVGIAKQVPKIAGAVVGAGTGAALDEENRLRGAGIGAGLGFLGIGLAQRTGFTQSGAQDIAIQKFNTVSEGTDVTSKQIKLNVKLGEKIEDIVQSSTGKRIKFTQGQLTDDASAKALEFSLAKGAGRDLSQEQSAVAHEALQEYYSRNVSSVGSPSSFIKKVEDAATELTLATDDAERVVSSEVSKLMANMDEQAISRNILDKINEPLAVIKKKVDSLFAKVPNLKIKADPIRDSIKEIEGEFKPTEDAIFKPSKIINKLNKVLFKKSEKVGIHGEALGDTLTPREPTMNELIGITRTIDQGIADSSTRGVRPNRTLLRRLVKLKNSIRGEFDPSTGLLKKEGAYQLTERTGDQSSKGIAALREANRLRAIQGSRFDKGTVAEVLQRGPRLEETKIALASIAKKFNSLDGIDSLKNAIGDETIATDAMRDFFRMDLINSALDKTTRKMVTSRVNDWVFDNSAKLKKLGLFDEFKGTQNAQKIFDEAQDALDIFNKSIAGKVLESDVGGFIKNAFSESKDLRRTARNLIRLAKGDKAAEEGLMKAMSKHLLDMSETNKTSFFKNTSDAFVDNQFLTNVGAFTKQVKKFMPAVREIFRKDPKRVKSLDVIAKAYDILSRRGKGGGIGAEDNVSLLDFDKSLSFAAGAKPGFFYPVKVIIGGIKDYGKSNVNRYLRRMMFDPEYAANMIDIARDRNSPLSPEKLIRFNALMTNIVHETSQRIESSNNPQPNQPNPELGGL